MLHPLRAASAATVSFALCLSAGAQSQSATFLSPFVELGADSSPSGYTTASFDGTAYHALDDVHGAGRVTTLERFPMPGNRSVELVLRPVDVWEDGGVATVVAADGSTSSLAPSVRMFSLHVPGHESHGFFGITETMMHGYLSLDGDTYLISTGPDDGRGRPLAISHGDLFTQSAEDFCDVITEGGGLVGQPEFRSQTDIHETRVFLELDQQFRNRFSSNQATLDYATLLVGATSEIYRRDLGCTMFLPSGYARVWNTTPPWGQVSTFNDVFDVRSWWNSGANPDSNINRAQVHVLTYPVFGGVAYSVGVLCQKNNSYGISSCYGSFPYPVQHKDSDNWDLFVFGHEVGHLYGSGHTFDGYSPPIDCDDGTGPDRGTIMSYCHQSYPMSQIGMRFHSRVQDNMRGDIAGASCANVIPIALGDYNGDGLFDAIDLAAFDAYVGQGFISRGAFETFDVDGNGVVNSVDRQLIEAMSLPPASAVIFNGSGANCGFCYTSQTNPVLGETWTTYVGSFLGAPIPTTIVVHQNRLATPISTKFGEVLVGGPLLYSQTVLTNGQWATHDIPLPLDFSLAGLTVPTQAIIFKPSGAEALNGLELQISTYE